jgi:hypothetical protein
LSTTNAASPFSARPTNSATLISPRLLVLRPPERPPRDAAPTRSLQRNPQQPGSPTGNCGLKHGKRATSCLRSSQVLQLRLQRRLTRGSRQHSPACSKPPWTMPNSQSIVSSDSCLPDVRPRVQDRKHLRLLKASTAPKLLAAHSVMPNPATNPCSRKQPPPSM